MFHGMDAPERAHPLSLFGAPSETGGEQADGEDRLRVVTAALRCGVLLPVGILSSAADHVKDFLVGTRKCRADDGTGSRNQAKVLPLRTQHLHAGGRGDVETPLGIDSHAVAVAPAFEPPEVATVGD